MTDDKKRIEELLPFAANGTLEAEEMAEVEAAIADDADLAAELAFLKGLRDDVKARELGTSPGELGLARLKRAIAAEEAAPAATSGTATVVRTNWWKAAAVAACALFAIQTAVVFTSPDTVVTLAGGGGPSGGYDGPVLTTAFSETATEAQIRTLLLEAGVTIVDGPSALGLYRLAPVEGADLAAAEAALSGAGIVESVSQE